MYIFSSSARNLKRSSFSHFLPGLLAFIIHRATEQTVSKQLSFKNFSKEKVKFGAVQKAMPTLQF